MLGKLMKYEIRAMGRVFLPLYGALLLVAAVSRISGAVGLAAPSAIGTGVAVVIMVSVCVITLVLTLQRFSRNLMGWEGYLMHTLPVGADRLIWSKLLVSAMWFIVSGLAVLAAVLIMAAHSLGIREFLYGLTELVRRADMERLSLALYCAEAAVACVLALFACIVMLYACLASSMLVNRKRGLFTFGAFVVFNVVGQTLADMLVVLFRGYGLTGFLSSLSPAAAYQLAICTAIAGELIVGAVFYILTRYMLTRRLNLE